MRRIFLVTAAVLVVVAPILSAGGSASAGPSKAAYSWHVADDFLEQNVGSPPWAVAEAPSGDVIMLDGLGLLDVAAKTASGVGRFIHLAPDGSEVASGTFTANRLVSFQFYGCGGEGVPDFLCGGLAKLDVTLTPEGTTLHFPATLYVTACSATRSHRAGSRPGHSRRHRAVLPVRVPGCPASRRAGHRVFQLPDGGRLGVPGLRPDGRTRSGDQC